MGSVKITFTQAGREALINAQNSGVKMSIAGLEISEKKQTLTDTTKKLDSVLKLLDVDASKAVSPGVLQVSFVDNTNEQYDVYAAALRLDDASNTVFAFIQDSSGKVLVSKAPATQLLLPFDITVESGNLAPSGDIKFSLIPATEEIAGAARYATLEEAKAGHKRSILTPEKMLSSLTELFGLGVSPPVGNLTGVNSLDSIDKTCFCTYTATTESHPPNAKKGVCLTIRRDFAGDIFQVAADSGGRLELYFRMKVGDEFSAWMSVSLAEFHKTLSVWTARDDLRSEALHLTSTYFAKPVDYIKLHSLKNPILSNRYKPENPSYADDTLHLHGHRSLLLSGGDGAYNAKQKSALKDAGIEGELVLCGEKAVQVNSNGHKYAFKDHLETPDGRVFAERFKPKVQQVDGLDYHLRRRHKRNTVYYHASGQDLIGDVELKSQFDLDVSDKNQYANINVHHIDTHCKYFYVPELADCMDVELLLFHSNRDGDPLSPNYRELVTVRVPLLHLDYQMPLKGTPTSPKQRMLHSFFVPILDGRRYRDDFSKRLNNSLLVAKHMGKSWRPYDAEKGHRLMTITGFGSTRALMLRIVAYSYEGV